MEFVWFSFGQAYARLELARFSHVPRQELADIGWHVKFTTASCRGLHHKLGIRGTKADDVEHDVAVFSDCFDGTCKRLAIRGIAIREQHAHDGFCISARGFHILHEAGKFKGQIQGLADLGSLAVRIPDIFHDADGGLFQDVLRTARAVHKCSAVEVETFRRVSKSYNGNLLAMTPSDFFGKKCYGSEGSTHAPGHENAILELAQESLDHRRFHGNLDGTDRHVRFLHYQVTGHHASGDVDDEHGVEINPCWLIRELDLAPSRRLVGLPS